MAHLRCQPGSRRQPADRSSGETLRSDHGAWPRRAHRRTTGFWRRGQHRFLGCRHRCQWPFQPVRRPGWASGTLCRWHHRQSWRGAVRPVCSRFAGESSAVERIAICHASAEDRRTRQDPHRVAAFPGHGGRPSRHPWSGVAYPQGHGDSRPQREVGNRVSHRADSGQPRAVPGHGKSSHGLHRRTRRRADSRLVAEGAKRHPPVLPELRRLHRWHRGQLLDLRPYRRLAHLRQGDGVRGRQACGAGAGRGAASDDGRHVQRSAR
ncbi:hypothetical protein [Lysobacter gummosus]|uniref:hypothetical protein n=1 Tax=Lysobacter gummosus TaxID=262324 RepID=UPI00364490F1